MPQQIKLPINAGSRAELDLKKYLRDQILSKQRALKQIHEQRVTSWRRAYEAQPEQATRTFPFENASNLVMPVVAIHSDTLLARIMSAVIKTKPFWVTRIMGEIADQGGPEAFANQDVRDAFEDMLGEAGLEPKGLDLYPTYHAGFGEGIRYGTVVFKVPHKEEVEYEPVVSGNRGITYERKVKYFGPKPYKVPFHKFLIGAGAKDCESASFKAEVITLEREELEERSFQRIYDPAMVEYILSRPDRVGGKSTVEKERESDAGIRTPGAYGFAEWDIHECWLKYRINGYLVRCIVWYHEKSDTILRAFFDYMPDCVYVAGRLFFRDDSFHGYGFAEFMAGIQEHASQTYNSRQDNRTVGNTQVWRVDPDSKLHQGYKIYPSAMLPAEEGEIEALNHGQFASPVDIEEDRFIQELGNTRTGVSAPQQGQGAGTTTKRGIYSAMGTMSVLQEGSSRGDLNITDFRYCHTKVGRLTVTDYAHFGLSEKIRNALANKAKAVERALEMFKQEKLSLPIYAATSSVNREVEKQNDLMLSNIMAKHYQMISQMLGAITNAMTPEPVKQYVADAINAANLLMRTVMRHFNYDEVERVVPDVKALKPQPATQGQPGQGPDGAPGQAGAGPGQPPGENPNIGQAEGISEGDLDPLKGPLPDMTGVRMQ